MLQKTWIIGTFVLLMGLTACTETIETTQIVLQQRDNSISLSANVVTPFTFEETTEIELNKKAPSIVIKAMDSTRNGYSWLVSKVSDGSYGYTEAIYRTTFDFQNNVLSKEPVPNATTTYDEVPEIHQYGASVERGAYFFARVITRYGFDCIGCVISLDGSAGTSASIRLNGTHVRQSDGTWREGITYDGYYIFAADRAYPHCTVVEITNHPFSGMGLVPGVPFRGLIVDRGSAITTNKLDLFSGSERRLSVATVRNTINTKVTVVGFLNWTRNSQGQRICQ